MCSNRYRYGGTLFVFVLGFLCVSKGVEDQVRVQGWLLLFLLLLLLLARKSTYRPLYTGRSTNGPGLSGTMSSTKSPGAQTLNSVAVQCVGRVD